MPTQTPKLNPAWVREVRDDFRQFLAMTKFPHPIRSGTRGSAFAYPEWLIMLIAILSVKGKVQTYLGIHRRALQYWDVLTEGGDLKPLAESQLRER